MVLAAAVALSFYRWSKPGPNPFPRALTRLTFDEGLQTEPTWSPDSRFIAYSSNRAGKFDIWMQQVSGGSAIRITQASGNNWQPDWSPDGKFIAYRSEENGGGIYIIPILGGPGLERKLASFGYHPRWSPDSSKVLFDSHFDALADLTDKFYVVDLQGGPPHELNIAPSSLRTEQIESHAISAIWHPDGKRISMRLWRALPSFNMVTVPLAGGPATPLDIPPDLTEHLKELAVLKPWEGRGTSVCWAPDATSIYYDARFRGLQNIWRMNVDSQGLRATKIERLTTGSFDSYPSISADGKKLAFTSGTLGVRLWIFPFDAAQGKITGSGHAITPEGMRAWRHSIDRTGDKVAFGGVLGGQAALWEKSLLTGEEAPIISGDSFARMSPQLSFDGARLAYLRANQTTKERQVMIWSTQTRSEEAVTSPRVTYGPIPYDWSPDGKSLLASQINNDTGRMEIWEFPVDLSPHAESGARKIISDPNYDFYQPHFSWNEEWIAVQGVRNSATTESAVYVMRANGGPLVRITDGHPWDDKPRWAPDGKTIYFLSRRHGTFNVWGIRFDAAKGKTLGDAFQVSAFGNGGPVISDSIPDVELSITQDKLILTMEERSGSIWMLENLDR